jgi:hypothetical protein
VEDFAPDGCAQPTSGVDAREGAVARRATASVADDAVILVVREADDASRTVVVYRASDCEVLAEVPL